MSLRRIFRRVVLPAVLFLAAAVVIAPYLRANAFRARMQAALERSLRREVTVGEVHFTLLHGPGFEADNVTIKDEPRAGVEPFAYVPSLEASLRLLSLFTGHFSFSTIRLDEPTVNLVKTSAGTWNVQEFMSGASAAAGAGEAELPDIEIRSARLNFKFGDVKSVFYVDDSDVDIYSDGPGVTGIRFTGEPARTDRAAGGFGSVSGRGLLKSFAGQEAQLSLGLVLERSNLSEIVTLIDGHDIGVHGFVDASAHFAGPLSRIGVTGTLTLSDLHRWDLIPAEASDSWPLRLRGEWDVHGQSLVLHTVASPGQPQPVALDATLSDYLSSPRWSVKATLRDVPASPLAETARRFGVPLPVGIRVDGKLSGEIAYVSPGLLGGTLNIAGGSVTSGDGEDNAALNARVEDASLNIQNGRITIGPARLIVGSGETATLRVSYDLAAQKLGLRVDTEKLSVEQMQSGAIRALGITPPPLLSACRHGSWRGWASYDWSTGEPMGEWSGRFELSNADLNFPDLAAPFHLTSASMSIDGSKLQASRLRGRAGKLAIEGDLRYDAEPLRPVFLRLHLSQADIKEAERVLQPLLARHEGLLARLRLRRAALPEWLKERRIDGSIRVDAVSFGDTELGSISSRILWNGPVLQLTGLSWKQGDSTGTGKLEINLAGASPQYKLSGRIDDPAWRDGELSVDGVLTAAGTGPALLDSALAEGTFEATNITLAPDAAFDSIAGAFQFAPGKDAGQLRLLSVQATQEQETFAGQGGSQPDGRILLELSSGKRQIRELTAGLSH